MTSLVKSGYIIKKDSLSNDDKNTLLNDLNVSPESFGSPNNFQEPFPVFRESISRYRIPRFYGIQKFGLPQRSNINPGISIDLTFNGSLKETLQQDNACSTTIKQLHTVGGGILSLPTGYGKTTCALYILSQLKVKTLIIVHKEFLMNQWIERINQFLPDAKAGILRQNKIQIKGFDITVAMLQSIAMKDYPQDTFSSFGLTIIDETHHICSKVFSRALFTASSKYMLGLSATPNRKDGLTKVLHWFLGPISFSIIREAEKNVSVTLHNFSCEYFTKEPPPMTITGQLSIPLAINNIVTIEERNILIVDFILDFLSQNRKTIVLSERRCHCENLLNMVNEKKSADKTCGLYMGGMKQAVLKINENCDVIFATYSLAHEGLDIPSLNTLILATPKCDVVQSCGRILRESGSKKTHNPLIIDIVDKYASFINQSKKRTSFYKKSGFNITSNKPISKKVSLPSNTCNFIND